MLKNHCNTCKICLFGQTNKQPLSNSEGWVLTLVAYFKKCKSKKKEIVKLKKSFFGKTKNIFLNFLSASFLCCIYKIENTSFLWIKTDRLKNFS